ncbi:MAG TPA: heparinase II/III family protein [Clostridiales bacterium]|nr:MAG: Heparinase II/III-like protein [Firmicutes bacterium ADurb.Bin262]HOU09266.1 heparinase II/III family protein [Clostridiales bacterium]HQK74452.1 heparinase II/III family protein [Clostridiales bacterium]
MKIFAEKGIAETGMLLPFGEFRPFSMLAAAKPAPFEKEKLILNAEERLAGEFRILKATDYMRFFRDGNRSVYEEVYFDRRSAVFDLLLGEWAQGEGRFADKLAEGVWHILEETTWVLPAHIRDGGERCPLTPEFGDKIRTVDLFSAATAALLGFVCHFARARLDAVSPFICERIEYETERRVLRPFLERDDHRWMGLDGGKVNNWNPWIVSNILTCAAFCVRGGGLREKLVGKALRVLDCFTDSYHPDGGCDEGPVYWTAAGASFFDALEIIYDLTGGKIDVFGEPLVRRMGEYILNVHIAGDCFIPFADARTHLQLEYAMVARFGRRTGSRPLEQFGRSTYRRANAPRQSANHPYRSVANLLDIPEPAEPPREAENIWLDGIQVMALRQAGGLYLAAKAGHNGENHNHNDAGNFVVYFGEEPLVIDAGVETYRRQTFDGAKRYEIWTMRSAYHNLPDINGFEQRQGAEYAARAVAYDGAARSLSMELQGAYPAEAGIVRFVRVVRMKDSCAEITDRLSLSNPGEVVFNILLLGKPEVLRAGEALLGGGRVLRYDETLSACVEKIPLTDPKLRGDFAAENLYRLRLSAKQVRETVFVMTVA